MRNRKSLQLLVYFLLFYFHIKIQLLNLFPVITEGYIFRTLSVTQRFLWISCQFQHNLEIFMKFNSTVLKKPKTKIILFHTKLAVSPSGTLSSGILSTDTSLKKKIVGRHTDRLFTIGRNPPKVVVGLYLKCICL